MIPSEVARKFAEAALVSQASVTTTTSTRVHAGVRANVERDTAQTMALVSIAESLERVSVMSVGLSDEAMAVLAGVIHLPTEQIPGIYAPDSVWEELREAFPRSVFDARVAKDPDFFDPDAGT